jgi:hypothetical protein
MIRRADGESWLLIGQPEHARAAGRMAEAWGAAGFTLPEPATEVVLAVREHDNGWEEWEAAPDLNPEGLPRHFTEMSVAEHLSIWRRGIARLAARSPYAALLVSMHAAALHAGPLDADRDTPAAREAVADFLAEQRRFQGGQRVALLGHPQAASQFSEENIQAGFRLLQLCDYLSLRLCCTPDQRPLELTWPAAARGEPTRLVLRPRSAARFRLVPYPFAACPLVLEVAARRVPRTPYPNADAWLIAFSSASRETLALEISAGEETTN